MESVHDDSEIDESKTDENDDDDEEDDEWDCFPVSLKKIREYEKRKYERRNPLTAELWEISSRCQYVESSDCLFGSTGIRSLCVRF